MLTIPSDLDVVAEVARLVIDLDAVVEVLLECSTVEDAVTRGLGVVNDELVLGDGLASSTLGLSGDFYRRASQRASTEEQSTRTEQARRKSKSGRTKSAGLAY
jgi:hypothetical protein